MNFRAFFESPGLAEAAYQTWRKRKDRLIMLWLERQKDERIFRIITELDRREEALRNVSRSVRAQAEIDAVYERLRRETTFVLLMCSNFECNYGPKSVGTAVKLSAYQPGTYTCDLCGAPLVEDEDARHPYYSGR